MCLHRMNKKNQLLDMTTILKIVSAIGLGLTVVPAFLVWRGSIAWEMHASLMLVGTILWFASAPFWMKKD